MIDDFQLTIRIYPIKHYQTINDVTMSCKFLVFFLWPGLVARPLVPSNWGMQCLTWLTTAGFRRDGDLMALGWDIVGFFNHIQQYIYESNGDKKKWKEQIDKYIHNTYIYSGISMTLTVRLSDIPKSGGDFLSRGGSLGTQPGVVLLSRDRHAHGASDGDCSHRRCREKNMAGLSSVAWRSGL